MVWVIFLGLFLCLGLIPECISSRCVYLRKDFSGGGAFLLVLPMIQCCNTG